MRIYVSETYAVILIVVEGICSNCKLALPPPTYGNCERVALACVALVLRSWSCRSPWFRNRNRLHHNSLRCM